MQCGLKSTLRCDLSMCNNDIETLFMHIELNKCQNDVSKDSYHRHFTAEQPQKQYRMTLKEQSLY